MKWFKNTKNLLLLIAVIAVVAASSVFMAETMANNKAQVERERQRALEEIIKSYEKAQYTPIPEYTPSSPWDKYGTPVPTEFKKRFTLE